MTRPETYQRWTERLRRFEKAQTTVAQFCKAEGVSQPSFYKWKKKLAASREEVTSAGSKFVPVSLQDLRLHAALDPLDTPAAECASTTIELPGGIRIHIDTPVQSQQPNSNGTRS